MIREIPEIKELLEAGSYQEAYDYLTKLLDEKPGDISILYTR